MSNTGLPGARINANSWLARRFAPKPPDAITCGVRVVEGSVPGEGPRWSYRLSGVDRLAVGGFLTITHGATQVRGGAFELTEGGARGSYQGGGAEEIGGARLHIAIPPNQAWRFGIT